MNIQTSEARDIGRFIRAKREQADIRSYPDLPARRRHVQHLTQGELAELVGVSTIVISQIEQARYPNVTAAILRKIATALRLTMQQELFLLGLHQPRPDNQANGEVAPEWVQNYAGHIRYPVLIVNPAFDILAQNRQAEALFASSSQQPLKGDNAVRLVFLEPGIRDFIKDWHGLAASTVSGLKMFYADSPSYRDRIENLAEDLSGRDETFRNFWEQEDPLTAATIEKDFYHPLHGAMKINQILTDIVEAPTLTKIDFLPSDDETRAKMNQM